jgi:amino acid transporter
MVLDGLKRVLVGRPLATHEQEHQKLNKTTALAVFSSDAISSTAYATEEILFVIAIGASLAVGLDYLVPIAIAVAVLLAIVITSYRQTIKAYPQGGAAYIVSRDNHGEMASLVAAASILVDYILTVAVSISAGTAAIISIPAFHDATLDYRVEICLGFVALIALLNLRGLKESGRVFAVPTYGYIVMLSLMLFLGLTKYYLGWFGGIDPVPFDPELVAEGVKQTGGAVSLFLILKGFSSGAVALTGVEAIADGVPAFRRPEAKNASRTLAAMGLILGTLFFGVSVLASHLKPFPSHAITVNAQMGTQVFGDGFMLFLLQILTAGILVLAANTAYADFPRLSSIVARDGYLPRQLANRGDRLVFSNGVIILTVFAAVLIVVFQGETNALIPLYAVGVFTSFTLSQSGMVRHHFRHRDDGWRRHAAISGVGATATFVVLLIVAITKFVDGAWVPLIVIPAIVVLFKGIKRHYTRVADVLKAEVDYRPRRMNHTVIVLVGNVHRGVLEALAYAKSLAPNRLLAVTVVSDEDERERVELAWTDRHINVPLEIVYSPYRELSGPILRFIDELDARYDNDIITVVIPEFVVNTWWGHLLHNQSALFLKGRLLFRKGTVVTSVPYHLE